MTSNQISLRIALVLAVVVAFACVASADTTYVVNGTFEPSSFSISFVGPLGGGTFSGTFTATLPVASSGETISTFNINLYNSSGVLLANLSSLTLGDFGAVNPAGSGCDNGSSTPGPCHEFVFSNNAYILTVLGLLTPLGFTGGSVYPGTGSGQHSSQAVVGGFGPPFSSLVASGSIDPTPEPGTFVLLGTALLAGLLIERKRLFGES